MTRIDGANENDIKECLEMAGLRGDGKTIVYDGRTGEPFDNPVTVGYMYYLKLHHLVGTIVFHARSTGPYSLVTEQPLVVKLSSAVSVFVRWRFGHWRLTVQLIPQEILTVKSDDVIGRVRTFEAIVKGKNVPKWRDSQSPSRYSSKAAVAVAGCQGAG